MQIILGLTDIVCGLLIIGVSLPLVKGKIPMNRWYGVRFKQSFLSDDHWYRINAYGGKRLIIWSVPVVLAGAVALFLPDDVMDQPMMMIISFAPILLVIAAVESYLFARKL
jgi:hypothetical protein